MTGITTLTTQFFLTDALGSVLATFSAIAGSAAVLGNQIYGPYGNQRYSKGPMGTAKGYTGQYADATGLDYYNARYYDPIVGLFVSADTVQGNEQGMDPYAYVGENPETYTDPTGQYRGAQTGVGNGSQPCAYPGSCGTISPGGSSSGSSGGTMRPTSTQKPKSSAGPSHANPKIVKATRSQSPHNCGPGTVSQGGTCVSDSHSKAGLYRENKLSGFYKQALMEELGGYGLGLVGDLLSIFNGAESVYGRAQAVLDLVGTLATSILPLVGDLFGGGAPSFLSRASSVLMGIGAVIQGVFAELNASSWWVQEGATLTAMAAIDGASGPGVLLQTGLSLLLTPVIGNLLDMGGHALLAKGIADYANYNNQMNMPIQSWCAENRGCPAL